MESESDVGYNTEDEVEYAKSFEKPTETEVLENGKVVRKPRKVRYHSTACRGFAVVLQARLMYATMSHDREARFDGDRRTCASVATIAGVLGSAVVAFLGLVLKTCHVSSDQFTERK